MMRSSEQLSSFSRWLALPLRVLGDDDAGHACSGTMPQLITTAPYPGIEKFAMDISCLKLNYLPRSGKHYVIVGFPATKSAVDSRHRTTLAAAYAYRSDAIDDSDYAAHGVDAKTHVVLPLDLRRGFDTTGRIVNFPKPQGMCGSPIVVLYGEPGSEDDSRVFPVVAVGTRYRKKTKVLIGTDVHSVGAIERFLHRSGSAQ